MPIIKTLEHNSFIATHTEWVFFTGTANTKMIIVKVCPRLIIGITEVCSHLPLADLCHSVYSLEATINQLSGHQNHFHNQPKILRSYPVHRIVCIVLYDGPSSIISVHVRVDFIRGKGTSPCYRVNTRRSQGLIVIFP